MKAAVTIPLSLRVRDEEDARWQDALQLAERLRAAFEATCRTVAYRYVGLGRSLIRDLSGDSLGAQIPDVEVRQIGALPGTVAHLRFQKSARCSGFNGAATNGKDERILFGTKTTDYGIMDD